VLFVDRVYLQAQIPAASPGVRSRLTDLPINLKRSVPVLDVPLVIMRACIVIISAVLLATVDPQNLETIWKRIDGTSHCVVHRGSRIREALLCEGAPNKRRFEAVIGNYLASARGLTGFSRFRTWRTTAGSRSCGPDQPSPLSPGIPCAPKDGKYRDRPIIQCLADRFRIGAAFQLSE